MTTFNSQRVLNLCIELQEYRKCWGVAKLMQAAVAREPSRLEVFALCRMLFTPKPGGAISRPALGESDYLGETSEETWPNEPIHLHNGVPFLIVKGWLLAGEAEWPEMFLARCLENGDWTTERYAKRSREALKLAAQDFMRHGPWKRSLSAEDRLFLLAQARAGE